MFKFVAVLFVSTLCVLTVHAGHGASPFWQIFSRLDAAQQEQARALFQNMCNETKANFRNNLNSFVSTLPGEIQQEAQNIINQMDQIKANITQRITEQVNNSPLSSEARTLITSVISVMQNQDISIVQEQEQIRELFQNAGQSVVDEVRNSGIYIPSGKSMGQCGQGNGGSSSQEGNNFQRRGASNEFGQAGFGQGGFGQGSFGQNRGFGQNNGLGQNRGFGQGGFGQGGFGQNNGFGRQGHSFGQDDNKSD